MTRQQKDMDLITKAKAGYQEAYTAMFEHYYQIIFKYIYCILKDYQDAEDQTMIIGAINNNGTIGEFTTKECAFVTIDDGLSDSEAVIYNAIVENYQKTLSRNV